MVIKSTTNSVAMQQNNGSNCKSEAYENLYEELDTKEGQQKVFKFTKMRSKSTKDITHIRQIKYEKGIVIRKERDILIRWKDYLEKLLNEENERLIRDDGEPNDQFAGEVTRQEVERTLEKMKNGKSIGPDGIPLEVWKILGDVITEIVREKPPWCVLYADDIVLVTDEKRKLERKREELRVALESRGMKISRSKTEYFTTDTMVTNKPQLD